MTDVVERVRQATDLVELVSETVHLRRQGHNWVGLCPFHHEKSPSFTVSPEKQLFHCFGCQASGDVFSFVMRRDGVGFREALERLARRAGIELDEPSDPRERERRRRRRAVEEALELAAGWFADWLRAPEGAAARRYLEERGVSADGVRAFGLGWAPGGNRLLQRLEAAGIERSVAQAAGLVADGEHGFYDRFRERLIFPIRDERGRLVGFGGRLLGEGQPKYLNSPESEIFSKRRILYGLDRAAVRIRNRRRAILVEGYMDALTAQQAGFEETVASLGTALTSEQVEILRRLAGEVVICYDADSAGEQATLRGLELLRAAGLRLRVAELPEGKDPDELIRRRGPGAFQAVVENARPWLEYRFERLARGRSLDDLESRVDVAEAMAEILAAEGHPVRRSEGIRWVAERLGVEEAAIRQEVERKIEKRRGGAPASHNRRTIRYTNERVSRIQARAGQRTEDRGAGIGSAATKTLLRVICHHPELVSRLDELDAGAIPADAERRAVEALREARGDPAGAMRRLEADGEERAVSLLAQAVMDETPDVDPERVLGDSLQALRRIPVERRIAELRAEIEARQRSGSDCTELLRELDEQVRLRARLVGGAGAWWSGGPIPAERGGRRDG
ncbi:MAG: DNA primase [Bacillota bacterium]|nr:DNA primase [Bacillota bacterium]